MKRVRGGWLLAFAVACGGATAGEDAGMDGSVNDGAADATVDTSTTFDAANDVMLDDGGADAGDAIADASLDAGFDAPSCAHYDPNTCSTLPPSALVNVTCAAVAPPAGGTIVDGYYLLTSAVSNTAKDDGGCLATTQTRKDTIEVCGDFMLLLDFDENNNEYSAGLTFSTSGTTLSTVHVCGNGIGGAYPYTATPTTISLYVDYGPTAELVLTLTKQ